MMVKDIFGWQIGNWNSLLSIRWSNNMEIRYYGILFSKNYITLHFGRLEFRMWKPKILRKFNGVYIKRKVK